MFELTSELARAIKSEIMVSMVQPDKYSLATVGELVDQYFSLQWCRENIVVPLGIEFNENIGGHKLTIAIGNFSFLATVGEFINIVREQGI